MFEYALRPQQTALINVDLQSVFVEGSPIAAPDGPLILERANELGTRCRAAGIKIIHTRHVLRPDGTNTGVYATIFPDSDSGTMYENNEATGLHPGLHVEEGDIGLDKPRYGAFYGTDLELILRSNAIDSVIVTGIATNVCCETTAREANARDFKVFFMSDGTCTFDMEGSTAAEIQKVTCSSLAFGFAQVLTTADMIGKIEGA